MRQGKNPDVSLYFVLGSPQVGQRSTLVRRLLKGVCGTGFGAAERLDGPVFERC